MIHIPPAFVFNIDESGFIYFVDSRNEIMIVPMNIANGTVKSAERNSKRATITGTISLDDSTLTPLIIITNKRYDKELLADGYDEPNVVLVYHKNGFISPQSFYYWAKLIFIPTPKRKIWISSKCNLIARQMHSIFIKPKSIQSKI